MKAVILVGGEGTRLRPLTYDLPKPMVPIVNKPFMEHMVDHLATHGIREIVFALGYKSEAFESWLGDGSRFGGRFWYEVESSPLGTAGPVRNLEALLDETFFVFNGDVLSDIDLTFLLHHHRERGALGTLALTPVDDPSSYGVVVTDATSRVQAFIEKPPREQAPTNLINAGVYVLEPSALAYMNPAGVPCSFEREVFPRLVAADEGLCAVACPGYWLDIGSPTRYLQANHDILRGTKRAQMPSPDTDGRWIGEGASVGSGARLEGPMWIGAGAVVEDGATLRGPLVLGEGVHVASGCDLQGAVVWAETRLERDVVLDTCLVGRGCLLEAGVHMGVEAALGSGQRLLPGARLSAGERCPA